MCPFIGIMCFSGGMAAFVVVAAAGVEVCDSFGETDRAARWCDPSKSSLFALVRCRRRA